MKKNVMFLIVFCVLTSSIAQNKNNFEKKIVDVNSTSFEYYQSTKSTKSKTVVIVFHDWFGVSDLSFEMIERINKEGMDVRILDLYKGKSAKTNQEAGKLMNSIDVANAREYIDLIITEASKKYDKLFIWGFSLGTQFATLSAIRNNSIIDGLVLFYGNTPQEKERLEKITFPSLMVMGSKDNPDGAIRYFNSMKIQGQNHASLFIYPDVGHAFAQKLFNGGANYDETAKEITFQVAFDFIKKNRHSN